MARSTGASVTLTEDRKHSPHQRAALRLKCVRYHLEGIVAKHKYTPYLRDGEQCWFKVRNTNYSQRIGREELAAPEL